MKVNFDSMKPFYSFSQSNMFYDCPIKYWFIYINNRPQIKNEALIHGIEIHEFMENVLKGNEVADDLIIKYPKLFRQCNKLREFLNEYADSTMIEEWISVGENMEIFDGDWRNSFIRGKCDLAYTKNKDLVIIDWKTGNSKGDKWQNWEQCELYAYSFAKCLPDIEKIIMKFIYVERNEYNEKIINIEDLPLLKNRVENFFKKFIRLAKDKKLLPIYFAQHPPKFCRNCQFNEECDKRLTN